MEANSDLHCSSSGSEVSTVEVKVKAKLFRGPLLGILFLCLVVGTWTPAMAAPNSNTPTTPLGDSNLDMEDPEAFEELCDALLGAPNSSVPQGEAQENANNTSQMYSIFDQLMDNWATRNQHLPTTSTITRPIQFVPQTTMATQQHPPANIQRQNVGGPIRARRQPRQNLNQEKIYDASIIDKEYINLMKNNQSPLLSEFPGAFMLKIDMIAGNGDSWISSVCEKLPTTTVTNAKRYQRRKHCELKSSPSNFNLYGCHCSSLWNNTDIDHDVRAPVDDVDRCCKTRTKCFLKIKQKKECANIKIFEIYEQKLNQTNYDWRDTGGFEE
uniref:Phospholipase A2 domain-containing protein n=1 Tax=Meloidogyne javanica TaxID=6303 RepID=A0A915MIW2_MELJA